MTLNRRYGRLGVDQDIRGMWAGSAIQTNFLFPTWQMKKSSGNGSVTFTDRQVQFREPGVSSSTETSNAFDDITQFAPSVPGSITLHVSNITIDNEFGANMRLRITDSPSGFGSSADLIQARINGNGEILVTMEDDGFGSNTKDSSQDNSYISSLNTIKLAWDGSAAEVTTDDASTEVTVTHSTNYPTGENLFLQIAARDSDSAGQRNVDFDVDAIEVGT